MDLADQHAIHAEFLVQIYSLPDHSFDHFKRPVAIERFERLTMLFNHATLTSTAEKFSHALEQHSVPLAFNSARNIWTQIIFEKNYPAALACIKAQGSMCANSITDKVICARLAERSRHITPIVAHKLFADAIREDLPNLSTGMTELVGILEKNQKSCLIDVFDDISGLGVIEEENIGYLPVSSLISATTVEEMTWLRSSNDIVASVVNSIVGIDRDRSSEIFISCHRAEDKKYDETFAKYVAKNIEEYSTLLAKETLKNFSVSEISEWEPIDYDEIRNMVHGVIERRLYSTKWRWLKIDCDLSEAMIDHLAARIRETMKWLCDELPTEIGPGDPELSIAHTAKLSMQKMLRID